jgi:hypothetical protein
MTSGLAEDRESSAVFVHLADDEKYLRATADSFVF